MVGVRKEAILTAGYASLHNKHLCIMIISLFVVRTLKTPQVLELSGIGDKSILEPLGIHTKIHLPGVGENMQEHLLCPVSFGSSNPSTN